MNKHLVHLSTLPPIKRPSPFNVVDGWLNSQLLNVRWFTGEVRIVEQSVMLLSTRPALAPAVLPVVAGSQASEAQMASPGGVASLRDRNRFEPLAPRDLMTSSLTVGAFFRSGGCDKCCCSLLPR